MIMPCEPRITHDRGTYPFQVRRPHPGFRPARVITRPRASHLGHGPSLV